MNQEITHMKDDKGYVQYSKATLKNILTKKDWNETVGSEWKLRKFSITYSPAGFNFQDYKNAWYNTFLFRMYNHSWFLMFCKNFKPEVPIWFYQWFDVFGFNTKFAPPEVKIGYTLYSRLIPYGPYKKELQFFREFSIPWISAWEFNIEETREDFPFFLIRTIRGGSPSGHLVSEPESVTKYLVHYFE